MANKLQHCPHCPDQGWYPDNDPYSGEPVQVQCEFCWTNPLSYFNAPNTACSGRDRAAPLTQTVRRFLGVAMWSYYGSKSKVINLYPPPKFGKVIEPFAGSARYALKYFDRDVLLVDKHDAIVKIWKWLQVCSKDGVFSIAPPVKPAVGRTIPQKGVSYDGSSGNCVFRGTCAMLWRWVFSRQDGWSITRHRNCQSRPTQRPRGRKASIRQK